MRSLERLLALGCVCAALSLAPCGAAAQSPAAVPSQPQASDSALEGPAVHMLTMEPWPKEELRQLVTPAPLTLEHPDLATYYQSQAQRLRRAAGNYARLARAFGGPAAPGAGSHFVTGRTAFYFHSSAAAASRRARGATLLAALNAQASRKQGCFSCHSFHGQGGNIAPDVAQEGARGRSNAWLIGHFRDPQAASPGSAMPDFAGLTQRQLTVLTTFLQSQR